MPNPQKDALLPAIQGFPMGWGFFFYLCWTAVPCVGARWDRKMGGDARAFARICTAFLLPRAQNFRGNPRNGHGLILQLWAIPRPLFSALVLAYPWRSSLVLGQVIDIFLSLRVGLDCPNLLPKQHFSPLWHYNANTSLLLCLQSHFPWNHYDWVSTVLLWLSLCLASFWLYPKPSWRRLG